MNETEKKFVKYLKLDHGLQYKGGNFIHTEALIDEGQLKIEDYTKVHIYEPTEKKQISSWDIISKRFQTLECEKLELSSGYLPREHLKIIIPVLKITYFGNPLDCFKSYAEKLDRTELCQQFLAETILVGGGLIIKNVSDFENKLKLDISKAHIIWIIDEISRNHKYKNPFKKSSGDYVNQLFSYEKFSVIAYEKVIPAFTRLDKQLQESFKALHKIPADWSMNINKRLVPGITSFHQEQDINDWLINNITINLLYWIKKYHMESGILVTQDGFSCSNEKVLEFLYEPEFNFSETTSLKIFHLKSPIDLLMNFNKIDVKEKQDFQINPFISIDPSKSKVDAIACNIIQDQLKIQIHTEKNKIKVSNQYKVDIEKVFESNNPYSSLINIFDKYGHYFCKNYIIGNSLESMCYSYSELPVEMFINFQRSKVPKGLDKLIKEWKIFQSEFEVNAFSNDRSIVKPEKVEKWFDENNSTYPEAWYVVNRTELIPIWKLLDSNIKERINELIKDEERILMTREEKIGSEITCHRIKFDTPLRSNQYQIIGSIFTIDYKKTSLAVKFRLMDCYGFYAIIEKHKSSNEVINSELKICWALIGNPLKHDYFNYELSNIKLVSGSKKIEMNKERISDTVNIDINRPIPPQNLIFATILEFPSTNFEPAIEFEDIVPLLKDSQDSMPLVYHFKWYAIDISGYENLFSWNSVGHEIMADTLTELISKNINSEENKVIKQYEYNLFSEFTEISKGPFGIVRTAKWDNSIIILKSINIDTSTIDKEIAPYEKWIETKIIEGRINKYNIDEFEDYKLINNGTSNKVYRVRIRNGLREEPTANTPHAYVTIYKRCWQSMQYDRPSIEDLAKALKDFKDFIDRYITANDKISHISTPYREKIISTPHMEEINILLLGEVGSGKSTFINAFANYFKFNSLDDAISVCDEDEHDMVDNVGESSTQVCGVYVFHAGNSVIRLIDTPGIGDTRGIEYDKKNFENILQNISQHKYLNGICILLKPNNSRLNITFKFCIQELLSHLHKSAKDNIVFCFTNTRGTFFRPGDTLPICKDIIYCFDNDPFRFLAANKEGMKFTDDVKRNFASSWEKSVMESVRLLTYITTRTPHKIIDTISLNNARQMVILFSGPFAEINRNIQENIDQFKEIQNTVDKIIIQFTQFLKQNAIAVFNDAYVEYLDYIIHLEREKANTSKNYNKKVLDGLEEVKRNMMKR
ncbi:19238_t:CDS:2 [Gigaspora rosea]|nr:19238_t:CDS:2 [Gigaspora rosea]